MRVRSSYSSTYNPDSIATNMKIIVTAMNKNKKRTENTKPHRRNFSVLLRFKFSQVTPSGSILHDLKEGFNNPSCSVKGSLKQGR